VFLKCFMWKLCKCSCWLIVEVIFQLLLLLAPVVTKKSTVFTRLQDKVFCYILLLHIWGCLKFACEVLNQTAPNWISLNRTVRNQTKACITDHHMRSALLWDIMQHSVVFPYWHFRTIYWSLLEGSRNPKDRTQHKWS